MTFLKFKSSLPHSVCYMITVAFTVLCIAVAIFMLMAINIIGPDTRIRNSIHPDYYIKLVDMIDDYGGVSQYFDSPVRFQSLVQFSDCLFAEQSFDYVTVYKHPLEIRNSDNDQSPFYTVPAYFVSEGFQDYFPIELAAGNSFCKSDYVFPSDSVPVIIGSNLSSDYHIGDTYTLYYWGKTFSSKIIGIMKPETTLALADGENQLDDSVIVPLQLSQEIPKNEEDFSFQVISRLNSINGYLFTDNVNAAVAKVDELRIFAGLPSFSYIGLNQNGTNLISYVAQIGKDKSIFYFLFMALIYIYCLYQIQKYVIEEDCGLYMIMRICGATTSQIYLLELRPWLFCTACSACVIFALLLFWGIAGSSMYIAIGIGCAIQPILFSITWCYLSKKRLTLQQ